MTPRHSSQLVVFDLGGVLVRLARKWDVACTLAGIPTPAGVEDPAFKPFVNDLVDANERGTLTCDQFNEQVAARLGVPVEHVGLITTHWLVEPFAGVAELIEELDAAGVATACLSNTNAHHWSIMLGEAHSGHPAALPLHRLRYRFASHLLGLRKPQRAIYDHVLRAAGVRPHEVVFFDDAPANIDGAKACGWGGCLIDALGDPAAQMRAHLRSLGVI